MIRYNLKRSSKGHLCSHKSKKHILKMPYSDLRKRMNIERDKITTAIVQVKAAPFSPNAKRIVLRTLPSKSGKGVLDELYRDSSEEKKKKK